MTAIPIWNEGDPESRWSRQIAEKLALGPAVTVSTDNPTYVESGYFDTMLPMRAHQPSTDVDGLKLGGPGA